MRYLQEAFMLSTWLGQANRIAQQMTTCSEGLRARPLLFRCLQRAGVKSLQRYCQPMKTARSPAAVLSCHEPR